MEKIPLTPIDSRINPAVERSKDKIKPGVCGMSLLWVVPAGRYASKRHIGCPSAMALRSITEE